MHSQAAVSEHVLKLLQMVRDVATLKHRKLLPRSNQCIETAPIWFSVPSEPVDLLPTCISDRTAE